MKKFLPGGNVIHVGGAAILLGIAQKGEDLIQEGIIIVKEDTEVVLGVIITIIEGVIDQDLLVDEVQEEALEDIEKEVIAEKVEVEIEVKVVLVFIENLEVKKAEINLMIVMIVEIMIINLGAKKV